MIAGEGSQRSTAIRHGYVQAIWSLLLGRIELRTYGRLAALQNFRAEKVRFRRGGSISASRVRSGPDRRRACDEVRAVYQQD